MGARDAILMMTSKHPELRERLSSKHRQFYMVLLDDYMDYHDMPESQMVVRDSDYNPWIFWAGLCVGVSGGGIDGQMEDGKLKWIDYPPDGFCYASIPGGDNHPLTVFIHEFAHVLEGEIAFLESNFPEQVKTAYKQMRSEVPDASNYHCGTSAREFWACGVQWWFQSKSWQDYLHDDFPYLAEIIAEWFPKVKYIEDKKTFIPQWTDEDGSLWASGEETVFHSVSWKIIEE